MRTNKEKIWKETVKKLFNLTSTGRTSYNLDGVKSFAKVFKNKTNLLISLVV